MVKYHKILTTRLQQKSTCSFLFVFTKKKIDSIKCEHYFYHKQLLISIKKKIRYISNGLLFICFRVIFNKTKKNR